MRERLRSLIAEALNIPVDELPGNPELGNLQEWDSLAQLRIMIAIEEEFGVELMAEAIMRVRSLDAIEAYLSDWAGKQS